MRYTSAIVAASMASTALGSQLRHGHRHRAREANAAAEAEPEATNYTFSDGQCWGTYGCNAKTGAGSQPSAAAQPSQQVQAQAQTTAAAQPTKTQAANPAGAVNSVVSQATSAAGSVASSVSSGGGSLNVQNLIANIQGGPMKAAVSDGSCVKGSGNKNVVDISNKSGKDLLWVCWGSAGSWVNANAPVLAVPVGNGDTETISFKDTPAGAQGGSCAPVFSDTKMVNGQIFETWLESTFNQWGTVDVSREPNMNGVKMSAKTAAGCTSDFNNCSFKCTSASGENGSGQCLNDYQLTSCTGSGANPGQPNAQNIIKDGGCLFGNGKMTVTIG